MPAGRSSATFLIPITANRKKRCLDPDFLTRTNRQLRVVYRDRRQPGFLVELRSGNRCRSLPAIDWTLELVRTTNAKWHIRCIEGNTPGQKPFFPGCMEAFRTTCQEGAADRFHYQPVETRWPCRQHKRTPFCRRIPCCSTPRSVEFVRAFPDARRTCAWLCARLFSSCCSSTGFPFMAGALKS